MADGKIQIIKHTLKIKDSIGLKKIEEKGKQFLVEKIIHGVEFQNPYENNIQKKPEIIETVETNYKIIIMIYQYFFIKVAEIFLECIHSLDPNKIQQFDDNIKSNGWGFMNLLEIDNSVESLSTFQLFYHYNGRLLLTNGLLIAPDGEVPEREEKVNLKNLYEMFRYAKSHGLVSQQFLGVLGILFVAETRESKNAITKLYKVFSYATLSGANDFNFDAISNLISNLSFSIKKITLDNGDKREIEDGKNAKEIINTTTFVPLRDPFEQEIVDDKFEDLEYKKIKYPYVEPQNKGAQTIETEMQTTDNEFSKLKQEFDKVNNALTEKKLQDDSINLIHDILDEENPFKNIDTEEIWIENGLFENDDGQDIKDISKEITYINEPFFDIIEDDFKSPI